MAACLRGILRVLQLGEWAVLLLIDSLYGLGDLPDPPPPSVEQFMGESFTVDGVDLASYTWRVKNPESLSTGESFIVPPSDPVNLEYFAMLDEEGSR